MGGHGGLNILPQKRWNVYGRENRLKVARDEAEQAALEQETAQRHKAAEAQFRHRALLAQARQRRGVELLPDEPARAGLASAPEVDGGGPPLAGLPAGGAAAALAGKQLVDRGTAQPPVKHFNLFEAEEQLANARNPEAEAEKRQQAAARGDPKTQTSDAKFDQRFKFGHGVTGEQAKPWYARSAAAVQPPSPGAAQDQMRAWERSAAAALEVSAAGAREPEADQAPADARDSDDSGSDRSGRRRRHTRALSSKKPRDKGKKHKRERKRDKGRERRGERDAGGAGAAAAKADMWAALRAERLERESDEAARQQALLASQRMPTGYNNTYGYASKARRRGP